MLLISCYIKRIALVGLRFMEHLVGNVSVKFYFTHTVSMCVCEMGMGGGGIRKSE